MAAPFIFETARGELKTDENPNGQPLGSVVDLDSRESMNPDTYDWAYVETEANTVQGAPGRVKVVCNNAIDGAGTTTYTWSFQGGNAGDGSFFAAATGGSALSGGGLAGTDLDTIYAQFGAAGTFTIRCALSNTETNPVNANKETTIVVS